MKGFTLIELMIVVAILAILAAIIIPAVDNSYQDEMNRTRAIPTEPAPAAPTGSDDCFYIGNEQYCN